MLSGDSRSLGTAGGPRRHCSRLAAGIYSAKLYIWTQRGRKTAEEKEEEEEEECIHGQLSAWPFITCSDVQDKGMDCSLK